MTSSIAQTIAELTEVLAALTPPVDLRLRSPAAQQDIRQAETALQLEFPEELRRLLLCHDGQLFYSSESGYGDPLVPMMILPATGECYSHYWLCGTSEIVEQTGLFREEYHDWYRNESFETFGPVRYHDRFLVITATENADCLVLDLQPEPGGTHGQVVLYCTQPFQLIVLSDSLERFLQDLVKGYRTGRFVFSSDEHFVSYCESSS